MTGVVIARRYIAASDSFINFTNMETGTEGLRHFFSYLRGVTFWDRIFRWSGVRSALIDASADLQKLIFAYESAAQAKRELEFERSRNRSLEESLEELKRLRFEKEHLLENKARIESQNQEYLKRGKELSGEVLLFGQKVERLEAELKKLREENLRYKATEDEQNKRFEQYAVNVNETMKRVQDEREKERKVQHDREIERLLKMKETWIAHEDNVKNRIKTICSRHGIEYLDSVPFRGRPDVTLRVNDEYVIFDAKSPAGDDLSNFPQYLKNQSEGVSKYVKEENVRREIFLVVPANTLEHLTQFEFRLSDYTVYVISIDSLEPIILALRRIEDYEFAEQLSPEERENICRVIGKFVHLSKRRIQIDGFFAQQFFELVYRSEADLPRDILESVSQFERSEKLNPPQEKRAKQISIKEIEADANKIRHDAAQKGIYTDESFLVKNLNKLPLYVPSEEKKKEKDQPDLFTDEASESKTGLAS